MKKFCSLFFVIAVITVLIWPTQSAEICPIKCGKGELVNICGRSGNICKRFLNDCSFQLSNCVNNNAFSQVDLSECRYIDLNVERICNTGILTIGAGLGHHEILKPGSIKVQAKVIRV